jgi:hypothetical protein
MAPRPSSPCRPTWASPWPSGTASGHARCLASVVVDHIQQHLQTGRVQGPYRHLELGDLPAGQTGPRRGRLAAAGGPLPRIRPLRPPSTLRPLGKYPPARPRRRDVATPEGQAGGRCLNLLTALRPRPLGHGAWFRCSPAPVARLRQFRQGQRRRPPPGQPGRHGSGGRTTADPLNAGGQGGRDKHLDHRRGGAAAGTAGKGGRPSPVIGWPCGRPGPAAREPTPLTEHPAAASPPRPQRQTRQ